MASAIYIFLFQENIDSGGQTDCRGEGWGRRASILPVMGKKDGGRKVRPQLWFTAASTDVCIFLNGKRKR